MNKPLGQILCLGILITVVIILFPLRSEAQETTATISGVVSDQASAVVVDAQVAATNQGTGIERSTRTDSSGYYQIPNLQPGQYKVKVEHVGFGSQIQTGITLVVGNRAVVNFSLSAAGVTETIEVKAEVPLVSTLSAELGSVIDASEMRELPLNTRSYVSLATNQPGAVQFTTGISTGATAAKSHQGAIIAVGGMVLTGNIGYFIDGQNITGTSTVGAPSTAAGDIPGIEAIQEFKIQRNSFSAESGGGSVIISYITRSGENRFHGNVYEFHRNSVLDARNFFDPEKKPPFKRNQFGFTFGGPMVKDRSFFFGNYEGFRQRLTTTKIATVPTLAARRGALPSGTVQVDPAVVPYLNMFPVPSGRDFGDGTAEALFENHQPVRQDFFLVRLDHRLSPADSLMARYSFLDASASSELSLPLFKSVLGNRYQYFTLKETHMFSNGLINDASFGFTRLRTDIDYTSTQPINDSLLFVPERKQFGTISFGIGAGFSSDFFQPLSTIGGDSSAPLFIRENDFLVQDNLVYTRGKHLLKAGLSIQRFQTNDVTIAGGNNGVYTFFGLENFLRNQPLIYQVVPLWSDLARGYRMTAFSWFIQEDWKMTNRFTLNIGLRHEFTTQPMEVNGKYANFVPFNSNQIRVGRIPTNSPFQPPPGVQIVEGSYFGDDNPTLKQFQPRVGFAYDPFGQGKTSIRGGFGVFNPLLTPATMQYWGNLNPPFAAINVFVLGDITFPRFPRGNNAANAPLLPASFNVEDGTPTALQYHLTIEQQVANDLQFHIGYEGAHFYHVGRGVSRLGPQPIFDERGALFRADAPRTLSLYPPGSLFYNAAHDGIANYHALNVGVEKRFSAGLQFRADYVWSKNIADFETEYSQQFAPSTGGDSLAAFDRKFDRGLSTFNVEHRFSYNLMYELPFGKGRKFASQIQGAADKLLSGWSISSLGTIQSGFPFTPIIGFNRSLDGNVAFPSDRPNLRPGFSNNPVLGGPDRYFDPNAFELPPEGRYGNLGRNTVIGPGLVNIDFSVIKDTQIGERFRMQFRTELFNALNRANFGLPANILFSPLGQVNGNAGRIVTTATTSRQIQFGLKIFF